MLMVFGIAKLRDMPVDVYPEFNPPTVEVQTEALGLSAAEVKSLITVPKVQVDTKQLQAQGVTLKQVTETAGEALWVSPISHLELSTPDTAKGMVLDEKAEYMKEELK